MCIYIYSIYIYIYKYIKNICIYLYDYQYKHINLRWIQCICHVCYKHLKLDSTTWGYAWMDDCSFLIVHGIHHEFIQYNTTIGSLTTYIYLNKHMLNYLSTCLSVLAVVLAFCIVLSSIFRTHLLLKVCDWFKSSSIIIFCRQRTVEDHSGPNTAWVEALFRHRGGEWCQHE